MPNAKVGQVSELLVKLGILGGMSDREGLAYALGINKNSLGHPLKAAELLNFVSTEEGNVRITEPGEKFAQGDEDSKRKLFLEQLKLVEPFATMVRAHQSRDVLDVREALNLVKAKVSAARKWGSGTDREMMKVVTNWLDFAGIKLVDRSEIGTESG